MKKNFEYAKTKKMRKRFKLPRIKYQIYSIPILLLPIAPFVIAWDKIKRWNYRRQSWSDAKATKALDYFLPHVLDYDEDDGCYYCHTAWRYNRWYVQKYVPLTLKTWVKKYHYELKDFLIDSYNKDGYFKTLVEDKWDTEEKWIRFSKKTKEKD